MANYTASQYIPSFLKSSVEGGKSISLTLADVSGSNFQNQDSFAYSASGLGLKSTQQLNVDWSKFENHTFFMSAEAKVNLAFEQIINGYPFDGTREEAENFFTNLTGFDKWVFDRFPKFKGQLHFSGTQTTETLPSLGTYIVVKDIQGSLFPTLSPKASAKSSVLNPIDKSLSIELQLKVPNVPTNGTQIIVQKINDVDNHGFSVRLNPTVSTTSVDAQFDVFSGSFYMTTTSTILKGAFNHLCFVFDKDSKLQNLKVYNNEQLVSESTNSVKIGKLNIDYSDLLIGSGSQYKVGVTSVTPQQTLSGSVDELRIFHSARTQNQQISYAQKSIFASPDLKLYYKFNEPPPPLSPITNDVVNSIVLDSSGNSLHSYITNFKTSLRENAELDTASNLIYERSDMSPVLFPAQKDVVSLNLELLTSASAYDMENPNTITKLIPRHYLVEGAFNDGLNYAEQNVGNQYGGTGIPGQGELSNVQIMLSLLYIWAKFFDEMKLFLDSFNTLRTVDYDLNQSIPGNLLFDLAKYYGFYIPPMFTNSTIEQYVFAENIDPTVKGNESLSLKYVQQEILRRILINLPSVIRSKGTQQSIKSFLRSIGIEPNASLRFREYGGPTYKHLTQARETKSDLTSIVNFTSSSLVISPFLSASRTEVGYPWPEGTFVNKDQYFHGISNSINDGLFTSGSWTIESNYKFSPTDILTSLTQSMVRLCVTGSAIQNPGVVANLVGFNDDINPKISLYLRPGNDLFAPLLKMSLDLPKGTLFDGDIWNIAFGCERNDSINSISSSSYFLRIGNQNDGDVRYLLTTSSYFFEITGSSSSDLNSNVFRKIDVTHNTNVSGTFISIGTNQVIPQGSTSTYRFLNNTTQVLDDAARETSFDGRILNVKFWSKAITEKEWTEHLKNYQSVGVSDPIKNYNYVTTATGSFEKLRLNSLQKQDIKIANSLNEITFLDFSENSMHMLGTGFPNDRNCLTPEIINYSHLSPYFDEAVSNEKIRVRGYDDEELINRNPWASPAPVYEIVRSEAPQDDVRFSIDFSLIDSLNKDIMSVFSSLDSVSDYLGKPELMFSPDYPDLEKLRNVYFNRIKDKLNFKAFMDFYSWFDSSIGTFIEQLLPRKTVFKGSNFIIESHVLERHKHEYYFSENYTVQKSKKQVQFYG